jgi:hypothetical protein
MQMSMVGVGAGMTGGMVNSDKLAKFITALTIKP